MKKRIIINIILAFVLETLIQLMRDYVKFEILNDHSSFSGSWLEYIQLDVTMRIIINPLIFLILILLPYNLILLKIGPQKFNYLRKTCIFLSVMVIMICMVGCFVNVRFYPYWKNIYYLAYFIPYSFLFAGLIHWLVDKRTVD
ncbi:hypothetical protein AQF98_06440 [Pedobacter sp. Hv1]|nr:hypothetical protein AQF98_06440 [Pedobacter sp. Hv1]